MRVQAEILGYNKKHVWIRIPYANAHKILTLPRNTLKRGQSTAHMVELDYDVTSLKRTTYYTADVEILRVISTRDKNKTVDASAGPGTA